MGKHKQSDKDGNLLALKLIKAGDKEGAAAVLKSTSRDNQIAFIKRVKRTNG